jgi:hypothetical protein
LRDGGLVESVGHAVKHVPFHLKLHSSRVEKSARITLKHRLSGEASNEQKDGSVGVSSWMVSY